MATTVPFKLITPQAIKFEGQAELVIAVTTEGEEGILPSHAPFLSALKPGILRANVVQNGATERLELATGEGFLQALPDGITVLVDAALAIYEIDPTVSRTELNDATERQRTLAVDSAAWRAEQSAIDFATAKLRLTQHL